MLDFAGFMRIFTRARLSAMMLGKPQPTRLRTTARFGGHDPRRPGDAARARAGLDAVPVARPVEHRRTRAHAAHAAHRGRAVRHRVRYRAVAHARQPAGRRADDSRSELDRLRAALFGVGEQRRASRGSCAMCGWSIRSPAPTLPPFDGSTPLPIDRLRLRKWNTQSLAFEDAAWPDDLAKMRDSLATRFIGFQTPRGRAQHEAPGTHREANDLALARRRQHADLAGDAVRIARRSPRSAEDLGARLHDRAARSGDHSRHAPDRADHAALPRRRRGSRLSRRRRQERRSVERWSGNRSRASPRRSPPRRM